MKAEDEVITDITTMVVISPYEAQWFWQRQSVGPDDDVPETATSLFFGVAPTDWPNLL